MELKKCKLKITLKHTFYADFTVEHPQRKIQSCDFVFARKKKRMDRAQQDDGSCRHACGHTCGNACGHTCGNAGTSCAPRIRCTITKELVWSMLTFAVGVGLYFVYWTTVTFQPYNETLHVSLWQTVYCIGTTGTTTQCEDYPVRCSPTGILYLVGCLVVALSMLCTCKKTQTLSFGSLLTCINVGTWLLAAAWIHWPTQYIPCILDALSNNEDDTSSASSTSSSSVPQTVTVQYQANLVLFAITCIVLQTSISMYMIRQWILARRQQLPAVQLEYMLDDDPTFLTPGHAGRSK